MKVKRCPICAQELLNEDAICQYCGKIHFQIANASLMDRNSTKTIKNVAYNRPILYVTDYFFAFDKEDITASAMAGGGAAAFGVVGALVGGLAGDAISAAKKTMKRSSTAIYYEWNRVFSLSYPMQPWPAKWYQMKMSADQGIDVRFKDGSELAVWIAAKAEKGRELYEIMNRLHRQSMTPDPVGRSDTVSPDVNTNVVSGGNMTKTTTDTNLVRHGGTEQIMSVLRAGMAADSRQSFFKCSYCGVTQMREGDVCSYCGKPAPAPASESQTVLGQQFMQRAQTVSGQWDLSGKQDLAEKQNISVQRSAWQSESVNDRRVCPSCGTMQETGNKFCVRCGQKLMVDQPKEKFCPHCGVKVMEGMLFCGECGTKLM